MGFVHVGQFRSEMQNPQMKVNRILQAAEELRDLLVEVEKADLLKQESFSRENKSLITRMNSLTKVLDEETIHNNALTKEIQQLESRIKMLHDQEYYYKEQIEKLQIEVLKLKKYKYKTREKFRKWLAFRLKWFKKKGRVGSVKNSRKKK